MRPLVLRFKPQHPLMIFLFLLGSSFSLLAQDFRPSHNFDLYRNKDKPSWLGKMGDGALTQEEYERRRAEYLKHNSKQLGVDKRVLERQLQELANRSMLDQQIQQAKSNEVQWQTQVKDEGAPKEDQNPIQAQANQDQRTPSESAEADQAQQNQPQLNQREILKKIQEQLSSGQMPTEEMLDQINQMNGVEGAEVPSKYQGTHAEQLFKNAQALQGVPTDQLVEQLKDELQKSPMGNTLSSVEPLLPDIAQILQHPEALPDASLIVQDRSKLMKFVVINIFIFFLSFFVKRKISRSGLGVMKKISLQTLRWLNMAGLRLGVFVFFYGKNVEHIWKILTT